MSKGGKILLGIFTFLPVLVGIILEFRYMQVVMTDMMDINAAANMANPFNTLHEIIARVFTPAVVAALIASVVTYIGLMIFYIKHALRQQYKSDSDKITWILLFVLVGYVAFIIYFFLKITPKPKEDTISTI